MHTHCCELLVPLLFFSHPHVGIRCHDNRADFPRFSVVIVLFYSLLLVLLQLNHINTDAESAGCFTMTDIYNWRGTESSGGVVSSKGPIYQLDDSGAIVTNPGEIGSAVTNKWLLTAELYVTDGAIFYCKGTSAGGDCDELRIQSTGDDDYYEVSAGDDSSFWGFVLFKGKDATTNVCCRSRLAAKDEKTGILRKSLVFSFSPTPAVLLRAGV